MIRSKINSLVSLFGLEDDRQVFELSLKMILILLLLHVNDLPLHNVLVPLMMIPGILIPKLTTNRFYWLALAIVFTMFYLVLGLQNYLPNHKYIFAYMLIAVTVVLFIKYQGGNWKSTFHQTARWIIGLCFLFATLGKFLTPDFLDGSFFEFTYLVDERFHGMTSVITGMPATGLYDTYLEFMALLGTSDPTAAITITSDPMLTGLGFAMAIWTIFIEGMIGISYLAPVNTKLHKWRELFLVVFILTTYPVATVPGFAMTLCVLAFIQSYKENRPTDYSVFYVLTFLAIPLFQIPFVLIWNILT